MSRYGSPGGESCYNSQLNSMPKKTGILCRYQPSVYPVVGMGELGEECGMKYGKYLCQDCGHIHIDTHSCNRRQCPVCWPVWDDQDAKRISQRFVCRKSLSLHYKKRLFHFVISLPMDQQPETEKELIIARKWAGQMAEEAGYSGAYLFLHTHRASGAVDEDAFNAGVKSWAYLHQLSRAENLKTEDLVERGLIKKGVHFHGIGWAKHYKNATKELPVKNIRCLNQKDGRFISKARLAGDIFGLSRYLLSHSAAVPGIASYSCYGSMSTRAFKSDSERIPLTCRSCSSPNILYGRAVRRLILNGGLPAGMSAEDIAECESVFLYGVCIREVNPSKLDGDV